MKHMKFSTLILSVCVLFFTGCIHDTEFFDGPFLQDRFGEFAVIEPLSLNRQSVDFSTGEVLELSAQFNKRVNFIVMITGLESGAVKFIEGFDNIINASNGVWSGGTTDLPLFRTEKCSVQLIIPEADSLTFTEEVEITGTKLYEGSLYTDFEAAPLTNIFLGNFEFEFTNNTGRRNNGKAAQGDWHYYFEGTDNVLPNYFIGLIEIKPSIVGATYVPVPTTIPEELYYNCFMYSDAGPHGIAVIQFAYDSNSSGKFEDGVDQTFQIAGDYPLTWVGWRHISHPMSDLGMTEQQLSKIVAVRVLLISNLNTQPNPPVPVDFGLDFITFTSGKPLQL